MILFETPLYTFELRGDGKILTFTWTRETKTMNFLRFKESCMIYAGLALEYHISLLLINTRDFEFELPGNYKDWKDKDLNPRYAKIPVKKHAFLLAREGFRDFEHKEFKESNYTNKFFDDEQKAMDWLLS